MNESFERLMARIETLITRIESGLPQPLSRYHLPSSARMSADRAPDATAVAADCSIRDTFMYGPRTIGMGNPFGCIGLPLR
jgi:hypothetical protein